MSVIDIGAARRRTRPGAANSVRLTAAPAHGSTATDFSKSIIGTKSNLETHLIMGPDIYHMGPKSIFYHMRPKSIFYHGTQIYFQTWQHLANGNSSEFLGQTDCVLRISLR